MKLHHSAKSPDPHRMCKLVFSFVERQQQCKIKFYIIDVRPTRILTSSGRSCFCWPSRCPSSSGVTNFGNEILSRKTAASLLLSFSSQFYRLNVYGATPISRSRRHSVSNALVLSAQVFFITKKGIFEHQPFVTV